MKVSRVCKSILYQCYNSNLRATLSHGVGCMWPAGHQLPTPGLESACWCRCNLTVVSYPVRRKINTGTGIQVSHWSNPASFNLNHCLKMRIQGVSHFLLFYFLNHMAQCLASFYRCHLPTILPLLLCYYNFQEHNHVIWWGGDLQLWMCASLGASLPASSL